jgi:hypothetical protein
MVIAHPRSPRAVQLARPASSLKKLMLNFAQNLALREELEATPRESPGTLFWELQEFAHRLIP